MLFKYLPVDRLDVIENLKIRFSPLRSLNDPFEAYPLVNISEDINPVINQTLREFDECWARAPESEKTKENRNLYEEMKEDFLNNAQDISNPHKLGLALTDFLKHLGVLSLSRTNSSLLMWSHYASCNKGYVIGFDEHHEFFHRRDLKGDIVRPLPVIYTTARSSVNDSHYAYRQKLFGEKPIEWSYEEEERLFLNHIDSRFATSKDEYGMDVILTDIPKDVISSVYLGSNSSRDTKYRVWEALRQNHIQAAVYQAGISRTEYKVEFEKIEQECL
ncbi:DUF2971 domain-containing protein [Bowmanella pacifica]|uniref:DUF2971 domain-containing protein n=1 Tax=Bowmanella pacifica TaxID=502051 RepID=A0A917Z4Q0_9ALTE|nr:DUF2971 domain-containing protein [Bowmanella pacifica]GGO74654.1 hypothetical protein GCM10010982_37980 [Bowmanella pacifica]